MGKKMLFIINPKAGKQQIKNNLLQILDSFTKNNFDINIYLTQSHGDAKRIIKERTNEFDLIVCSGGDGTLNEVISGMMESSERIPIGYLPAGTTNDFSKSLNIPNNLLDATNIIANGQTYACDVGSFNERYFIYVAAFGIFTSVPYQTKQEVKNILGYLAYILEGIKRLNEIQSYCLEVEYNGEIVVDDFMFGMITNSTSVGGLKNVASSHVYLNDGLFEVTLIKVPKNLIELQEIITALLAQTTNSKHILTFKADNLVITSDQKISWTLDGEFGGEQEKTVINNLKEAITFFVPDDLKDL